MPWILVYFDPAVFKDRNISFSAGQNDVVGEQFFLKKSSLLKIIQITNEGWL